MKKVFIQLTALILLLSLSTSANIIRVPGHYPTIQQGIDASNDGDTVLVQPGTYVENVNFNGRNVLLCSMYLPTGDTTYISNTIIDGDSSGTAVTFENGEDSTTVITGFTIQNGYNGIGGGVLCSPNSNPIICYNKIINNVADVYGGGIGCFQAQATIINNVICDNTVLIWYQGMGGGIYCEYANPLIENNIIARNSSYG